MVGQDIWKMFDVQGPKNLEKTDMEESDDDNYITLRAEKIEEEVMEPKKEKFSGMVTRSRALLDIIEEDSSESEDEEGNYLVVSEEMVEPTSFHEAYFDKDPNCRNLWRNAISKELENMEKCDVWSVINKSTIPSNQKLIRSKWVFKEKRDRVFRARLVALGYSQIPGIDFIGNYSLVMNNSSFRILILLIAKLGLKAWSLDVETTFLNGDLEEEIYMKLPQGFNGEDPGLSKTKALKLNKSIYGLVQAGRQ
jgi:Reverse transcriptase (RNA-dependent DNA polymerase)